MSHKKLIIGNWKMNPKTLKEARAHFLSIKKGKAPFKKVEASIAPPFVYLPEFSKLRGVVSLTSQNVATEKEGAYTGEISAKMLSEYKVSYCIVGHSERRALGESDKDIHKKIQQLLAAKIQPVLCVGEVERDPDMWYLSVVKTQIEEGLKGISKNALKDMIIAYEPVWAISSTKNRRDATPEDFEEMSIYIRKVIADTFGHDISSKIRILYGGSVNEKNAKDFLSKGADGLLSGKASLSPKKFLSILKTAHEIDQNA